MRGLVVFIRAVVRAALAITGVHRIVVPAPSVTIRKRGPLKRLWLLSI